MNVSFAKFISLLFNPILVLLGTSFLLTYKTTNDLSSSLIWTGYTIIFLVLITLFILYCVRRKVFTDMDVSKREQRPLLFIVGLLATVLYLIGLLFMGGPGMLFLITVGVLIGVLLASVINVYIKASIHVATISALVIAVVFAYRENLAISLLLISIPLVAWSRLKTKRHTLQEIIVGAILGVVLSLSVYMIMKVFLG